MRTFVGLAAVVAITITTVACTSPAPTAPSMHAAISSDYGFSAPVAASQESVAFCNQFQGEARGLCHAVIGLSCTGNSPQTACANLWGRFSDVTGRTYIGRSVEECAAIRVFCAEGQQAFFDPIGCGCEPIP